MLDIYSMCGISGIILSHPSGSNEDSRDYLSRQLVKMSGALEHRGPDGEAYWVDPDGRAGFGHRRLAIIDLSREAAQPMQYGGRYTLVLNGEIYNYIELKNELAAKGYSFRTKSDTEVLLAAYDCYQEECLQYLDGMFAFALWDAVEQSLLIARDRFGEKPLYYRFDETEFSFASERKALWAAGLPKKVNQPLLLNYLVLGYTQTPLDRTITFFQDVYSLPPAHYLKLPRTGFGFELHCYWDCNKESRSAMSEAAAVDRFRDLLQVSVKRRLRSDVPLGSCLSGGLVSSSILAAICRLEGTNQASQSFSSVYPGFEKDESSFIKLVAEKFNVRSHLETPDADRLIRDLETLCYYQEEPFGSASVFSQYCVFRLAAENGVKVLLDGQGADEILAGYGKYIHWYLQELLRSSPRRLYQEQKAFKHNGVPFSWGWKNYAAALFPVQAAQRLEKRELHQLQHHPDIAEEFRHQFLDPQSLYKPLVTRLNDMLYFSTFQSGLEELLRYADRNSMAHGREVRLPFLSHELVEFVFSLPSCYKIHDGWTKYLLRRTMDADLPQKITWRKEKTGFEPPQRSWMENSRLQEWIMEAKKSLVGKKVLKPEVLHKKIQPREAYAADNFDWRYLVAANCMTDSEDP